MTANMVVMPTQPLAAEIRSCRTISGMLPNFDGLKMALCAPMKNSTVSIRVMLPLRIATMPKAMIAISATLQPMITVRLLKRSAK
jgi:hypothetical protein